MDNVLQLIETLKLEIDWLFEDEVGKEKNNKWISKALLRYISMGNKAQFFKSLTSMVDENKKQNFKQQQHNYEEERLLKKLNFMENLKFKQGVIDLLSVDSTESEFPFPLSTKYFQKVKKKRKIYIYISQKLNHVAAFKSKFTIIRSNV